VPSLWGSRFFARPVKTGQDYESVMNYIEQNPVKAELAACPEDWKASAAFYRKRDISGLVDFTPNAQPEIKQLPLIPNAVSRLIPAAQLDYSVPDTAFC
jgi:hypothetical protein